MKKTILFAMVLFTSISLWAGVLTEKGIYQGKNLFVQNPMLSTAEDFCTKKVVVNGVEVITAPRSSAYEIDLSHIKLKSAVIIEIHYSEGCIPKILNLNAIKALSHFSFTSFNVDEDGIHWSSKGESDAGTFYIQHFINNAWVTIREEKGKGHLNDSYDINSEHHSGLNKYRIRYLELSGQSFYSKTVEFESSKKPVVIYPRKVTDKLYFKPAIITKYVIYDKYGNVVLEGKAKEIDCTSLKPHEHYTIEFDNQTKEFIKKEKNSYK